jgi:hypothetical protein
MDEHKVQTVLDWPIPCKVCATRAFLVLVGYCHRFIRDYGAITTLLTKLLCKDAFKWTNEAEQAFCTLHMALTKAPILQLPAFDRTFIVECDVSEFESDVVLHQDTGPLAFSVARSLHGMRSWQLMNRNSSPWSRQWAIGGHTCGGARSWCKRTTTTWKFLLNQRLATIPQHQ